MDAALKQEMLMPELIDQRASVTPDRTFAFLPKGQQLEDGFFPLTYGALANAVNAMAW